MFSLKEPCKNSGAFKSEPMKKIAVCPVCHNEEIHEGDNYCMICGTRLADVGLDCSKEVKA